MSKGSVKVEGGKMVNVEVQKNGSKVKLTGDFFLQPPNSREKIEEILQDSLQAFDREEILKQLNSLDTEFIGFDPEDVLKAFQDALDGESL